MKKLALFAVSLAVLGSTNVFAQGKTRAQVYQELIEAKQDGLDYVTEASYPELSPLNQAKVAYLKQQALAKSGNVGKVATAGTGTNAVN